MIYRKPDYYDSFRCLAGDCPNTCCTGWDIAIDGDSLDRYLNTPGALGRKLFHNIDWSEGCFLPNDGRCAMLTGSGLCEIQQECGHDALCSSCREYPRHTEEYPGVREFSLSMSCPEAARLILFSDHPDFVTYEDDLAETEDFEAFDEDLFERLNALRKQCMALLVRDRMPVEEIKRKLLSFSGMSFDPASERARNLLESLYRIDPSWDFYLEKLNEKRTADPAGHIDISAIEKRILTYFLYVYLPGAVYDNQMETKLCLAVFCAEWIGRLIRVFLLENPQMSELETADLAARFCREIEHSDENLDLLEEGFYDLQ